MDQGAPEPPEAPEDNFARRMTMVRTPACFGKMARYAQSLQKAHEEASANAHKTLGLRKPARPGLPIQRMACAFPVMRRNKSHNPCPAHKQNQLRTPTPHRPPFRGRPSGILELFRGPPRSLPRTIPHISSVGAPLGSDNSRQQLILILGQLWP